MNLTLRVTYPATDGSMPESVELEWTQIDQDSGGTLLDVLGALLRAPSVRSVEVSDPGEPRCKRTACGHRQSRHGDHDDMGRETSDPHLGACLTCDNPDQCRSFVGRPGGGYLVTADVSAGALLGLLPDGSVRPVRDMPGALPDLVGPAAAAFKAGDRIAVSMGMWVLA